MASLKIPYGLRDGELVHIDQVASGKACDCICPNPLCNAPLIAKKRKTDPNFTEHFAHHNPCGQAIESIAHYLAKEVFAKKTEIRLPAYREFWNGQSIQLALPRTAIIDNVYLEQTINDFKPDIVIESGKRKLFVEIAVTHFVDDIKAEKVAVRGVSMIEVDLSHLKNVPMSYEVVEAGINQKLYSAEWIHHAYRPELIERWLKKQDHLKSVRELQRERLQRRVEQYKKPVEEVEGDHEEYWEVLNCPLNKHIYKDWTIIGDCMNCEHYKGFRDNKATIVCLAECHEGDILSAF